MLDELLSIRRRREDDAKTSLNEAQHELHRQQAALQAKERELTGFAAWRGDEQVRLYQVVHQRNLSRRKLDEYRQQIARLRSRELHLEDDFANTKQAVEEAHRNLAHARQKHISAHRNVLKLEAYQQHLTALEERKAQRREETEMEDIIAACL